MLSFWQIKPTTMAPKKSSPKNTVKKITRKRMKGTLNISTEKFSDVILYGMVKSARMKFLTNVLENLEETERKTLLRKFGCNPRLSKAVRKLMNELAK